MRVPSAPSTRIPGWLWIAAPGILTLFIFITCILNESFLAQLNVSHMRPYFTDLVAALAASDAQAAHLNPYAIPSPFDPFGRPHVYGPWWLYLHKLGLTRHDSAWLGTILVVASLIAFAWVFRARNWRQALAATAIMASPPLLLAYERGNIDLVVILVFVAAGMTGPKTAGVVVQGVLIWVAAALKFYPIAAVSMLAHERRPRETLIAVSLVAAAILATACLWWTDIHQALSLVPQPKTVMGYGLKIIPLVLKGLSEPVGKVAFVLGLALGTAVVAWTGGFRRSLLLAMTENEATRWFIAGGSTWAFCYFLNINYPYRVVLLLLPAATWFRIWGTETGPESKGARNLIILLSILVWLHVPHIKDMLNFPYSPSYLISCFSVGIEQGLALGLTLVLVAAFLVRAGVRISPYLPRDFALRSRFALLLR